MGKYVIIFMAVMMSLFGIVSSQTDLQTAANIKNRQYTKYLTSATTDAASEMVTEAKEAVVMPYKSSRERVVNTFFSSLAVNFGYDTGEDLTKLRMYVPVVCMIDTDGYYIAYNKDFITPDGVPSLESAITTINTWSNSTAHIIIRYYLGNKVDVTFNDNKFFTGKYSEIYNEVLKQYGNSSVYVTELKSLGFNDRYEFERIRNETIIQDIQDKVEYYINNQNKVAAALQPEYIFEMPLTKSDDWVRLLENPTVISFMQGIRISDTAKYLNIYSLGGGEVRRDRATHYNSAKQYVYDSSGNLISVEDAAGYVNGEAQVADSGHFIDYNTYEENVRSDGDSVITEGSQKARREKEAAERGATVHHHTGSPVTGGGCYVPVYHKEHNENCYEVVRHLHTPACFGMVSHVHDESCYRKIYHTHVVPAEGVILADGTCTVQGGCYGKAVNNADGTTTYSINCGKWTYNGDGATEAERMATHTDSQKQLLSESYIRSNIQSMIDEGYLTLAPEDIDEYVKKTLATNKQALINNSIDSEEIICGHETGDQVKSTEPTCGLAEGAVEGKRLICGKTEADIDHYEIGCGYENGELVTG